MLGAHVQQDLVIATWMLCMWLLYAVLADWATSSPEDLGKKMDDLIIV